MSVHPCWTLEYILSLPISVFLGIFEIIAKLNKQLPNMPKQAVQLDKYSDNIQKQGNRSIKTISFNSLLDNPALLDKALRGK